MAIKRLLAERPAITRRWLSSIAQRTAAAQHRLIGLLGRPLNEQTAALLLDEATDNSVELSQRMLAATLGVRRPSLNNVLRQFEQQGLIDLGYRGIAIHDRPGLARAAGQPTS